MRKPNYELYSFCMAASASLLMIVFCFVKLLDKNLIPEDKVLYGSWLTGTMTAWSFTPGSRREQDTNTTNTYIDSERTSVAATGDTTVNEQPK